MLGELAWPRRPGSGKTSPAGRRGGADPALSPSAAEARRWPTESTALRRAGGRACGGGRVTAFGDICGPAIARRRQLGARSDGSSCGNTRRSTAHVVVAEDVTRGKHDPEVYVEAAGASEADRSARFEDAVVGVQAARGSGMRVFGIATRRAVRSLRRRAGRVIRRLGLVVATVTSRNWEDRYDPPARLAPKGPRRRWWRSSVDSAAARPRRRAGCGRGPTSVPAVAAMSRRFDPRRPPCRARDLDEREARS